MTTSGPRPVWTTLIVLVGTALLVGGVVFALSDRTPADLVPDSAREATPSPPTVARPEVTAQPETTAQPTAPEPAGPTPTPTPEPTAEPVLAPIEVFNGTALAGLASRASTALGSIGWSVTRVDNAAFGTVATTLYVPSGLGEAAETLLRDVPEITRVRPAFEGLSPEALTLVLAQPDAEDVVAALESDAADAALAQ